MANVDRLQDMFFEDLKKYNKTNFRSLMNADLMSDVSSPAVNKVFSSVVTRYFIFKDKHRQEATDCEFNALYFKLKIDLISDYFSKYPDSDARVLRSFQEQARSYYLGKEVNASEGQVA